MCPPFNWNYASHMLECIRVFHYINSTRSYIRFVSGYLSLLQKSGKFSFSTMSRNPFGI